MAAYDPYDDGEDYYTLSNPILANDRFAPGSEGSVAFDAPSSGGVRYPLAVPASGGQVGSFGSTADWDRVINEMIQRDRPAQQAQYNAEVARVDRNAIADAGSDPLAVQQAIRVRGTMKYNKLIADGATPAEALRLTANELYYNSPTAQVSAMNHSGGYQVPNLQTVPGGRLLINPSGAAQYIPDPKVVVPKEVKPTLPPDALILRNQATGERKRIESAMAKVIADPRPDEDEKKSLLQSLDQQLRAAKANELFHSTNRLSTTSSSLPIPAPAETPTVREVVRVTSGGRKAIFDAETKKFLRYATE